VAWHDTLESELAIVESVENTHTDQNPLPVDDDDVENYFSSHSGFDISRFIPPSIFPSHKRMFIDFYVLGVRDLKSDGIIPITKSLLEIEITNDRRSAKERLVKTNSSRNPSAKDANILERIVIPVDIPDDPLFMPSLEVRVKDEKFGYVHYEVGSASIPLTQADILGDGQSSNQQSSRNSNPFLDSWPDLLAREECIKGNGVVDAACQGRGIVHGSRGGTISPSMPEDDGIGIDIRQEELAEARKAANSAAFQDVVDVDADVRIEIGDESRPPPDGNVSYWSRMWGRDVTPLQGQDPASTSRSYFQSNTTSAEAKEEDPLADYEEKPEWMEGRSEEEAELETVHDLSPFQTFPVFSRSNRGFLLSSLFVERQPSRRFVGKVKGYVRILEDKSTPPFFDLNELMIPSSYLVRLYVLDVKGLHHSNQDEVNPYLKIKLGKDKLKYRDECIKECADPKFFKVVEIKSALPGQSQLHIEVWDKDRFSPDELCGTTVIDLEDRWFSKAWQKLGSDDDPRRKPIELRTLWRATSVGPQGIMRLWLDILPQSQVAQNPAWNISLPVPQKFEIRLIVWKVKGVLDYDGGSLPSADLYFKCWLETQPKSVHRSDTHWRAKNGVASFNWRFKYEVDAPLHGEGAGYLHVQLWDRNMRVNECLCDHILNLERYIQLAHRKLTLVDVFGRVRMPLEQSGLGSVETTILREKRAQKSKEKTSASKSRGSLGGIHNKAARGRRAMQERLRQLKQKAKRDSMKTDGHLEVNTSNTASTSEYTTLLDGKGEQGLSKLKKERKNEASDDAKRLIAQVRSAVGFPELPENSAWLKCTRLNHETGKYQKTGMILASVEIVPRFVVEQRKNGLGRGQPNEFPVLPAPEGRLKLRALLNPFTLLREILGPKACVSVCCLFCFVIFGILVWQLGPVASSIISFASILPPPADFYFPIAVFSLIFLCCCTCCTWCYVRAKRIF
jgi:hypothetical protein